MDNIYKYLLPKLHIQFNPMLNSTSAIITLEELIQVIAESKGISYEEELKIYNDYKDSLGNIVDLNLNEFDEYEEIKD